METKFNVFEILQIAEQVEHNEAKFYLRTAELFDDPQHRNILYKLANWRAKHEKVLAARRKDFSEKTGEFGTFDPDNYILSNPKVMAGLAAFAAKPDAMGITGREGKKEILQDAIARSKQAIAFYHGLKDFAKDPTSRDAVEQIIEEERHHIEMLRQAMEQGGELD